MLKISVIMPVYNGEKYIKETIESVLNQSYKDFEFIIIDDGSTDNTLKIIQSFNDQRVQVVNSDHRGIVEALNIGLKISRGEYIVRIDADDICLKDRFDILLAYMEANRKVVVCGSWAQKINENREVVGKLDYPPVENKDIKKFALLHNPFIHPSVIFRKEVIYKVGMYGKFKHNEDYEFWTRVLKVGEGHNISEELLQYRIHENQVTKKSNLKMRLVGLTVRVLAFARLSF